MSAKRGRHVSPRDADGRPGQLGIVLGVHNLNPRLAGVPGVAVLGSISSTDGSVATATRIVAAFPPASASPLGAGARSGSGNRPQCAVKVGATSG